MRASLFVPTFLLFLIISCGTNNRKTPAAIAPSAAAPTATPIPTSGTPVTSPGTGTPSGSLWTSQQLQSATQACAQQGDTTYSMDQWTTFCSCFYNKAAAQFSYNDFVQNFDNDYQSLSDNNAVTDCLTQANIGQ